MDLGLEDRRAAIAGASSGLGLATARALAAEGVRVAICGRDHARIEQAAASIDGDVVAIVADVATTDGADRVRRAGRGRARRGRHPGGQRRRPAARQLRHHALDAYPRALQLNLLSTVAMCQAAVPAMQARGWGRVVAITSISVRQPIPGLILSNTARAGVTGFLKTLALEVAGDGVTVNSVLPGLARHRPPAQPLRRRPVRAGRRDAGRRRRPARGLRRGRRVPLQRPGPLHHRRRHPGRRRCLPGPALSA